MGLNKRNMNITYLNLKEGKIYQSTDKDKTNPFDEVEGLLTNVAFRDDEFNGEKIRKANFTLNDGDNDYVLSVKVDSSYFGSLMSFLKNADVTKPLAMVPFAREEKDGRKSMGILVRQNGKFMKAYYTKDNPNGLPAFNKVVVSGKTLWDKTAYLNFLEGVLINEIKPQLNSVNTDGGDGLKQNYPDTQYEVTQVINSGEEVADDLPF